MNVVPIGTNVVVKCLKGEEMSAGGIVLPDIAQNRDKPQQGRVLAVGDGRLLANGTRVPHQVWEGDRVVFGQYAGTPVTIDGEEVIILNESDIWVVVL